MAQDGIGEDWMAPNGTVGHYDDKWQLECRIEMLYMALGSIRWH
jgi:hypothetical protein